MRDVTASGVRIRVAEQGSGPPLVLLHGELVDHTTWDGVVAELARDFRCVCPDLPGSGQSAKPNPTRFPYGVDAFAETVADLYAGLDLGRAALVGHGLGGAVAFTLAVRHPELVSRLALLDAQIGAVRTDPAARLAGVPVVGSLLFKQAVSVGAFERYLQHWLIGPSVPRERIAHYYEHFTSPAARGAALATVLGSLDGRAVEARTSQLRVPTLVLWGRHDPIVAAAVGQRLAREIRGAGLELLDAGHAPHEERPREVAELLRRFLQQPPASVR